MSLALDLRGDVAELFDDPDFGRDIIVRRFVDGVYDPNTGAATRQAIDFPTRGLILTYRDRVIDGTIIRQGDRKVVLAARDVPSAPKSVDQIIALAVPPNYPVDETFAVVNTKQTELGGEDIVYVCQVRKG